MQQTAQPQKWHVAQWGTLGWLETIAKLIGIVCGWIAFSQSAATPQLILIGNSHLAAVIVFIILSLGAVGMVFLRVLLRDIFSMIFAILNLTGFLSLLIAILRASDQVRGLAIAFGVLYVIGELIKQRFLATSGYTEGGTSTAGMLSISRGLMFFYIIFIVLMIV